MMANNVAIHKIYESETNMNQNSNIEKVSVTSPLEVFGFDFSKTWEYENGFYLTSDSSRLAKSISQWELYKKIVTLPGLIVECGVFKGASLIRFATYREILESQQSRKIIGFDAFGTFPAAVAAEDDKIFIEKFEHDSGNGISKDDLETILLKKQFRNIELYQGNVLDLLPKYISANPQLKIALLHIDVDVYEPTKACLEYLYDKVVTGGVIIFDDYSSVGGATKAIDDFIADNKLQVTMQKMPYYSVPSYIVKP